MSGPTKSERDIWEVSNQLAGFVGPNTPDDLAEFLIRESKAAEVLAAEITRLRAENAKMREHRKRLDRRIHRQRVANRDNWEIVEKRRKWLGSRTAFNAWKITRDRLLAAKADIARKDEALEPFAEEADLWNAFGETVVLVEPFPDLPGSSGLTVHHLRRARAARMPAEGRAALEQEGG